MYYFAGSSRAVKAKSGLWRRRRVRRKQTKIKCLWKGRVEIQRKRKEHHPALVAGAIFVLSNKILYDDIHAPKDVIKDLQFKVFFFFFFQAKHTTTKFRYTCTLYALQKTLNTE